MNEEIFRKNDIRGTYNKTIDELVYNTLGKSFGTFIKKYNKSNVIAGYDNRLSSYSLHESFINGILSTGSNVIDIGLVTSPMLYFARSFFNNYCAAMITASHNPKEDNGIKLTYTELGNAYGSMIEEFKDFTLKSEYDIGKGKLTSYDIKKDYIDFIKNNLTFGKFNKKIVVDAGNGTASIIIKELLDALNITYFPLYCESDGNFPNHHPDPLVFDNLKELSAKVKELNYDFGLSFDADADRVGIVDEQGNVIPIDKLMIIIFRNIKYSNVVFDVRCGRALINECKKLNQNYKIVQTGASTIGAEVKLNKLPFGGECSGHLFFNDKYLGYDDGIYAGLRLYEILSYSNKKLSEQLNNIDKYYDTEEIKYQVGSLNSFKIVEKVKEYCEEKNYSLNLIDGVKVENKDSWALIRPSSTSSHIALKFEATTESELERIKQEFINLLNNLTKTGD